MKPRLLFSLVAALICASVFTQDVIAQYPKNVLIEQFTSATCGPCVPAAPILERVTNLGQGVLSIKYHLNFPAPNDPLYLNAPADNARRQAVYSVNSIPTARVSGTGSADPRSESALNTAVTAAKVGTSPVSLKVLFENGVVKVRILSATALNAHRLFVSMISKTTSLPNLPQTLAYSNGQTSFSNALLGQLAGPDGVALNIAANTPTELEFPAFLGTSNVWQIDQQFAIAFVQATAGGAILQVNATRDPSDSTKYGIIGPRSRVTAAIVGSPYGKVARNGTYTQTIAITNQGTSPVPVRLGIKDEASRIEEGWTVNAPADPITVAAGATVTADVTLIAPGSRSLYSSFEPFITAADGITTRLAGFNVLVDGGRVAMYTGLSTNLDQMISLTRSTGGIQSFTPDIVILPFNTEANIAYPVTAFEGAVYVINFDARGQFGNAGVVEQVKTLLAAGKRVWVMAEGEMTANFNSQSSVVHQSAVSFLSTTLGFQYVGFTEFVNGNQLTRFTLNGVSGSPIGNGLTLNGHTVFDASWPTYQLRMDLYTLTGSSPSKSCLTIPVNTQSGQVVCTVMSTYESPQGGRLVYSSAGTAGLSVSAERNDLVKRVFDYLFPVQAPGIELSASSVNFGEIEQGQTRDRDVTVRNTGNTELLITGTSVSGGNASDFTITTGGSTGTPIAVQPGATHRLVVRFSPSASGERASFLLVTSNAGATASTVELMGRGAQKTSVETDVVSETGALGLRLLGANPIATSSNIEVSARGGSDAVVVTVVDATGRTIATLYNGSVAESTNVAFDASQFTSGMYSVVATSGSERAVLTVVVAR